MGYDKKCLSYQRSIAFIKRTSNKVRRREREGLTRWDGLPARVDPTNDNLMYWTSVCSRRRLRTGENQWRESNQAKTKRKHISRFLQLAIVSKRIRKYGCVYSALSSIWTDYFPWDLLGEQGHWRVNTFIMIISRNLLYSRAFICFPSNVEIV